MPRRSSAMASATFRISRQSPRASASRPRTPPVSLPFAAFPAATPLKSATRQFLSTSTDSLCSVQSVSTPRSSTSSGWKCCGAPRGPLPAYLVEINVALVPARHRVVAQFLLRADLGGVVAQHSEQLQFVEE